MRKTVLAIAALALIASGTFASLATVNGADHRDAPGSTADALADINDIYAARNGNNLVVSITGNPLIVPSDNQTRGVFDTAVQFQIHIDRNGDLRDEATVNLRFTGAPQTLIIEGLGAPISAPVTPPGATSPIITDAGPVRVFAGLRDDPFFFDLAAFRAFVANPQAPARGLRPAGAGDPVDALAGTNVMAIVIELPITVVTGGTSASSGTIKTWVSSSRGGQRIDRMAIPAANTALIPSAQKDAFNAGEPATDAATFRATAANSISTLRTAVQPVLGGESGGPLGGLSADQVAAALIPDVVTIDFSQPVQFPNGRRPQDDVIDVALGVVLNRGGASGISDGISANDKAFLSSFPYLAEPHTAAAPAAPTAPAIAPPSTGDAGLFADSGTMWVLSAGLFALAVTLGAAGVWATMRHRSR